MLVKEFFKSTTVKSRGSCSDCNLHRTCLAPKVRPYGDFKKGILVIGEAPGAEEDKIGKPWQGKAGRTLQRALKEQGISLFSDCLSINAINCRPIDKEGNNRTPTNHEIASCRSHVLNTILENKPKVIIPFGGSAITSLLGHRWKDELGTITRWRGWTIPDKEFNAWICPTFHSSYIMRKDEQQGGLEAVWKRDLKQAIACVQKPVRWIEPSDINIITDLTVLEDFTLFDDFITIDYETTSLKPYTDHSKVICASIAVSSKKCFVFMIPNSKDELRPFTTLLTSKVKKVAHNIKFEGLWSQVYLKTPINNWYWDTMLAAHVLDNRSGITGLKFQTYVNFGVLDYKYKVEPYLHSKDKNNTNSPNRIEELIRNKEGKETLLTYCGQDALYTYNLALKQIRKLS